MKKILLSIFTLFLFISGAFAQDTCITAVQYCNGTPGTFTFGIGGSTPADPAYGCLLSVRTDYWFYFRCTNGGDIHISVSASGATGSSSDDVDFICWGPFSSLTNICSSYSASNILDCDYTTGTLDTIDVNSANLGDYYLVMLSNFADQPSNVVYDQIYGTGTANCITTAVNQLAIDGKLDVFPNPTDNGLVEINFGDVKASDISIEVQDVLGRTIYKEDVNHFNGTYKKQLDLTAFNKGAYFVKVKGTNGFITKKIIYN